MKKLIGALLIAAFFVFPLCANADIFTQVSLTERYFGPTQTATFVGVYSGGVYLDYELSLNNGPWLEGFCVEGQFSSPSFPIDYTLLSIRSYLGDPQYTNYKAAAYVAQLWSEGLVDKSAAQLAIWEIAIDGLTALDLSTGKFYTVASTYTDAAKGILTALPSTFPDPDNWALAVNPPLLTPGPVPNSPYQNYLVPVPEPGILILLGIAMSAIGAASWRLRKL
jgi:hypothetical protein